MLRQFEPRTIPWALLLLCLLSFGLLIPWLGFYWDDWPVILTIRTQELAAFWDFYQLERPFSGWTYLLSAPLLGTSPLPWHIFTLLLRWVTILGMWWSLRGIWPQRGRETAWMALLFAIYPVFTQQPVAVAFSQHWITFGLYFLSLGAMIQSIRSPRWFWPFTLLGLLAAGGHMFTMEYFLGLELLRPLVLWLILPGDKAGVRRRLLAVGKAWLPYLLILVAVVIWRMFFLIIPEDPNRPDLLYSLATQPAGTVLRLLQIAIQDLVYNLAGSWYTTIQPQDIVLTDRAALFSLAIALLTAGMAALYLLRLRGDEPAGESRQYRWIREAAVLGLLGALLGSLPVWLTDRQAIVGLQSGRFSLAAMFGLSILLVALLEWFTPRRLPKVLLVALLVGASTGFHIRNATAYYRSWLQQRDFAWQLAWRAPHIQPGTALLSNDELYIYVGRAATAMQVNLLYPQPEGDYELDYWFLELPHDIGPKQVGRLPRGRSLTPQFRMYTFNASSLDSLVIFYKTAVGRCLWVLSPDDHDNMDIPDLTRVALPVSNLNRIGPDPAQAGYPPPEIYGDEPEHGWCYYYQKASLAHQLGDWEQAAQLGDEAQDKGLFAASAHEWLPFIEAYAYTGRWKAALDRTQRAFDLDPEVAPRLCRLWERIQTTSPAPAEVKGQIDQTLKLLQCE